MATTSMTVKITPNDSGNPMTSTEHRRFNDHEIAQDATPTMNGIVRAGDTQHSSVTIESAI